MAHLDSTAPPRAPLRAISLVVLALWAVRNVAVEGNAIFGTSGTQAPWASAAAGASVDPTQAVLRRLDGEVPTDVTVTLVAAASDRTRAMYWANYFLYPRSVTWSAAPGGTEGALVFVTRDRPATPPGYRLVAVARDGDHWVGGFARTPGGGR